MSVEQVVVSTSVGTWWWDANKVPEPHTECRAQHTRESSSQVAVGGAASQCRFSGRTAKPIFSSPPLETHQGDGRSWPHRHTTTDKKAITPRLAKRGRTCDDNCENLMEPESDESAVTLGRRWVFDLDAWRWVSVAQEGSSSSSSSSKDCLLGSQSHARYLVSARRWGDGRDGLSDDARNQGSAKTNDTQNPRFLSRLPIVRSRTQDENDGFSSVGGFLRHKEFLTRQIILPLHRRDACHHFGLDPGRGVLIWGPPGSGKTHLARCLAAEGGFHVEYVSAAECVGNEGAEARLRRSFNAARSAAPAVLILDEIDALAPNRSSIMNVSDIERRSTSLTLSLMDALRASSSAVAIVAITSRPEALDPACRRPGRLDVEIALGAPTQGDRESILRRASAHMALDEDVDLAHVATMLRGCMAAEVAGTVVEAALRCVAEQFSSVEEMETEEGCENTLLRLQQRHFVAAAADMAPSALRGYGSGVDCVSEPHSNSAALEWEDVGGLEEVKSELQELVEWPLVHGDRLAAMGLPPPSGALLYGPPGCGKTLLARVVASRCGANFVSVSGPELLQKWLGESERAVRDVFAAARSAAPCVVFFDEVDALAPRRTSNAGSGSKGMGDPAAARVLNQLLCEVDGILGGGQGVFVLAATNRPEALDPALLRPGRLDRLLKVPLPDAASRGIIFTKALRRCPLDRNLNLMEVASGEEMEGMSGADVKEVARRAGTALVREYIRSLENSAGGPSLEVVPQLRREHVESALLGMRRSVSVQDAAHHDSIERQLREGSLPSQEEGPSRAQVLEAVVTAVTHASEANLEIEILKARVLELESALIRGGIDVPEDSGIHRNTET